jgi:hypothetical protein
MPPAVLRLIRVLLLGCAFGFPFVMMMGKSITGDEVAHLPAGYSYWRLHEIVLNPMHPPLIKELAALPLVLLYPDIPIDTERVRSIGRRDHTYQWPFGEDFLIGQNVPRMLFWGRLAPVLISLALAALVLRWAMELWGPQGGLLSLFLYVFDPTITAHAQLVTTDVGCALFSTLFLYCLRNYARSASLTRLAACGVALGLALGAKFSSVVMIPLATLLLAVTTRDDAQSLSVRRMARAGMAVAAMGAVAYATVWVLYFFPTDPLFYLRGLSDVQRDHNPRYLHFFMGDFRHGNWPSYFLVAFLIKTPIPALLLLAAAIVAAVAGWRTNWRDEAFLVVPILGLYIGYAALASPIGIRYVIPCLPFLFIFTGRLAQAAADAPRVATVALAGVVLWCVAEFVAIWPDHLSYFNEIAGGSRGGVAWLDDSNVDWGQGFVELRRYVREHDVHHYRLCNFGYFNPSYYGIDGELVWLEPLLDPPAPGTLILSSHCVARVGGWLKKEYGDGEQNWMAHVEPKAIVGHAYWVYDIPGARAADEPYRSSRGRNAAASGQDLGEE